MAYKIWINGGSSNKGASYKGVGTENMKDNAVLGASDRKLFSSLLRKG